MQPATRSGPWPRFLAWWQPPLHADPAESERARSLWILAWSTLGIVTVALVLLVLIDPATLGRRAQSLLLFSGLIVPLHFLNRRGHTTPASWILVIGLVLVSAQRAWGTGGVQSPITVLHLIYVMMAGVLLGGRGATVTALCAVASSAVLLIAESVGWIEVRRTFDSRSIFIVSTIVTVIAILVQYLAANTLRRSLAQTQEQLAERRRAEARLRLAMDAAQISMWEMDPARRQLTADRRLFDVYDLPYPSDGRIRYDEWLTRVHPDDVKAVNGRMAELLAGADVVQTEFRAVHRDGTIRSIFGAAKLLDGDDQGRRRVVGVNLDITERKRAATELERLVIAQRERLKELRLLHDSARLMQRHHGTVESLLEELVPLIPVAWQFPELCEARIRYGRTVVAPQGWRETPWIRHVEFGTSEAGGRIEVAYRERPPTLEAFLPEEDALLESLAEILTSQIELKRHQEHLEQLVETRTTQLAARVNELRQAERLRDDLVHMIVHDLRFPLTGLIGHLELARESAAGDMADDLKEAAASARHLEAMANTLLDVSRLEHGAMPLMREPADLTSIAAVVAQSLAGIDPTRTITVDAPEAVVAVCDAGLIRRVLQNLVSNGIKHSPAGGRLVIELRGSADRVRVAVIDDGPGVPEAIRPRLFEKFGAVGTRKDQTYHSAGLGLAFCKLAVEAHGGTIGVTAAQPRGSVFAFELPTTS